MWFFILDLIATATKRQENPPELNTLLCTVRGCAFEYGVWRKPACAVRCLAYARRCPVLTWRMVLTGTCYGEHDYELLG
eukprot:1956212-Rhodomonas_salina.3